MFTIKNYDSRSNLSDFQVGNMYSFYLSNIAKKRLVKIEENNVAEYVKILNDIISNNDFVKNSSSNCALSRVVGIVIDKYESTTPNKVDTITVMFKTNTDDYVLNKYAVNTSNVLTNEKNYFSPAAVIKI